MFIKLVESNRKANRSPAGALASVALHTALIIVAVVATANARTSRERPFENPTVIYVPQSTSRTPARTVVKPQRPALKTPPALSAAAPIVAPVAVTTGIPDISPAPQVDEATPGIGTASLSASDAAGASGGEPTGPLTASEVDKAVRAFRTNRPPSYPEMLRARGMEGEVLARYVVDEKGRVDMKTFEVVSATNPAFASAVRAALERARYEPAEAGGRRVAQLVEQRFQFRLDQ